MSRALFLTLIALSAVNTFAADRPHVLLICVDDLKPNLGCYGDQIAKSPHIDALARRGTLFERAYCNQAVCSPSRNALLVGRRPQTLGIYDLPTNFRHAAPDAVTLPQHFKAHGYRTEALGKIFHVGQGNHEDEASWSVPHWRPGGPQYHQPESLANARKNANGTRGTSIESGDVEDNAYGDGKIADEARRRLLAAKDKPDEPFFLAVGFLKPHLPFVSPKKYWDLYDRKAFPLPEVTTAPEGAPAFAKTTWGELRSYSDIPQMGPLADEKTLELIHGYHAALSYMDAQLGRVLATLDETGLSKNTIIVLWGDHGWHLGDHGQWCKHTNYEQAARIPLIVAAPGASPSRTSSLVETVDIYPTLCELAGLRAPEGLDGASFAGAVRGTQLRTKESVIHVYPRNQLIGRAIRTSRHRLVEWKTPGASTDTAVYELYDYETDAGETKNLASAQPDVVEQLQAILARYPEAKPQLKVATTTPKAKPPVDRNKLFANKDKDNDGKLTKDEFLANQPDPDKAPARFTRFDADGDGVLTKDEFVSMGQKK